MYLISPAYLPVETKCISPSLHPNPNSNLPVLWFSQLRTCFLSWVLTDGGQMDSGTWEPAGAKLWAKMMLHLWTSDCYFSASADFGLLGRHLNSKLLWYWEPLLCFSGGPARHGKIRRYEASNFACLSSSLKAPTILNPVNACSGSCLYVSSLCNILFQFSPCLRLMSLFILSDSARVWVSYRNFHDLPATYITGAKLLGFVRVISSFN